MRKSELTNKQLQKLKKGLCVVSSCRNKHIKYRNKCHKHKTLEYKQKHPIKYAYQTLRTNARRRGKSFSISFEYFEKFCIKTKIMLGRGINADSYHIDRIDESKGYEEGNLQVLTNAENVRKYREYNYKEKKGYTSKIVDSEDDFSDVPF